MRAALACAVPGAVAIVAGVYLWSLPAALVVAGLLLCGLGWLLADDGRAS